MAFSIKHEVIAIYLIFFYAIAFPIFYDRLGSAGAILINGGLIVFCSLYLFNFSRFKIPIHSDQEKKIILIIISVFGFYFFSISASTLLSERLIFRDLYELHRPVLYTLIFCSSLYFFKKIEHLKHLKILISLSFIIVVFLGINHYFRIEDSLSALYTKRQNIITERVSTPFPNPYDYSFYMLWPFCYFFIRSLTGNVLHVKVISAVLCLLSSTGVFLTQSRTGLILLVLEVFLILPVTLLIENTRNININIISKKIFQYPLIILLVICFTIIVYNFYASELSYLIVGIQRILLEGDLGTGQTRVNLMALALEKANNNFFVVLLGHGPSKAILENPEAGYAYFIYRYGFLTLILFFFLPLFLSCFYLIKIIRRKKTDSTIYMAILAWYLSLPVAYLSTNFTEQIRLSFLYYFLMGFIVKSYFLLSNKK
ncbi:hypothetical protein [Dactylococcopsis salina]|uniref:O-Antigen ligase n=1 Tax=Dactylococcopsis salina (strain PCC 8305) TaxID=13035 RepID=K9YSI7_DACS8|nr:hypothetical protein [Dactylococcopsis salina]AFZ49078.1 hypothetical protein Dacsa_0271 [Dactylococcopsis salina PCC 8305]